jgi:hypothetical protein
MGPATVPFGLLGSAKVSGRPSQGGRSTLLATDRPPFRAPAAVDLPDPGRNVTQTEHAAPAAGPQCVGAG